MSVMSTLTLPAVSFRPKRFDVGTTPLTKSKAVFITRIGRKGESKREFWNA